MSPVSTNKPIVNAKMPKLHRTTAINIDWLLAVRTNKFDYLVVTLSWYINYNNIGNTK